MGYVDLRCVKCSKLLGRINGDAEIKCPRCRSLNVLIDKKVKIYSNPILPEKERMASVACQ